jgi:hypothetical protein
MKSQNMHTKTPQSNSTKSQSEEKNVKRENVSRRVREPTVNNETNVTVAHKDRTHHSFAKVYPLFKTPASSLCHPFLPHYV